MLLSNHVTGEEERRLLYVRDVELIVAGLGLTTRLKPELADKLSVRYDCLNLGGGKDLKKRVYELKTFSGFAVTLFSNNCHTRGKATPL